MVNTGPNSLPSHRNSLFDNLSGRRIDYEEMVVLLGLLARQLGGSAVFDGWDITKAKERGDTVQLLVQNDPWRLIIKAVDNESNL